MSHLHIIHQISKIRHPIFRYKIYHLIFCSQNNTGQCKQLLQDKETSIQLVITHQLM